MYNYCNLPYYFYYLECEEKKSRVINAMLEKCKRSLVFAYLTKYSNLTTKIWLITINVFK